MKFITLLFLTLVSIAKARIYININNTYPALNEAVYKDVLDEDQCHQQVRYIRSNPSLLFQFVDAGIRIPRGVTTGNLVDFGNYFQCLGITHETEGMPIQGKYCTIDVPLSQNWTFPWNTNWGAFDLSSLEVDAELIAKAKEYNLRRAQMLAVFGVLDERALRSAISTPEASTAFTLAVCIPKPCSTQQAITSLLFNVSAIGFQYEDGFCRLPDDKPWSPADTVAAVLFSAIGVLTLLSLCYDLVWRFVLKRDPKQSNRLCTSFSAYTNGQRLMNFSTAPGTLHCLDGIRTLAMMWVVVGHVFTSSSLLLNFSDFMFQWFFTLSSIWIIAAPITVDTFFCIAGILIVYSSVGKMNGVQLLKNLPFFYLNRLLRIFPLLAAAVLLQASYFNRMSDGPYWNMVQDQTNYCRSNWWLTLLHVQNYIGISTMCLPHSWYIAIDIQLYIISPVVLFWVFRGSKKTAWIALVGALLAALIAATIYNFINNFPSMGFDFNRVDDLETYMHYYYFNTFTRASPFFVGMLFGYVLHNCRGKKLNLHWILVTLLWLCAASITTTVFFYPHFVAQWGRDNQLVDNIMNSFMRPAWSLALCWMIIACTHGYGGPVNWFLTLDIWKLPARISYATFIFHYPIIFVVNDSALAPTYFSVPGFTFTFLAHMTLSTVVAYFATLLIDAPFSTLSKMILDKNKKKPVSRPVVTEDTKPDYEEVESDRASKTNQDNFTTYDENIENKIDDTDLVPRNDSIQESNLNRVKNKLKNESSQDNNLNGFDNNLEQDVTDVSNTENSNTTS